MAGDYGAYGATGFMYKNISSATTTVIKTGSGKLHSIVFNKPSANGSVTIYDNTAASGTIIATITSPATLLQQFETLVYDINFQIGLTVVTSSTDNITVTFQ